jgi:uncharacterized protein
MMLTPDESRVLGVLIEKQMTTPEQYPLSLNALTNGANQKSNREPVLEMEENDCFAALESLREKGLVIRSDLAGSRVNKYRHQASDVLRLRIEQQALLAELLLRGPQTLGELRGRASRMTPLESTDYVKQMLTGLMDRSDPLVRQLPPSPGSRAERYAQLLCPDLHPLDAPDNAPAAPNTPSLAIRVEQLEQELASVKTQLQKLQEALGVTAD